MEKPKIEKYEVIILTPKKFKELQEIVGLSRGAIYQALRFISHGENPDRVRKLALSSQFGGVKTVKTRVV